MKILPFCPLSIRSGAAPLHAAALTRLGLIALVLLSQILMTSCDFSHDVKGVRFPDQDRPKICVIAFLAPTDDVHYVQVTTTTLYDYTNSLQEFADLKKYGEVTSVVLDKATVTIEDLTAGTRLTLQSFFTPYSAHSFTQTEFPILEGHTYRISVQDERFGAVAGECTIPSIWPLGLTVLHSTEASLYSFEFSDDHTPRFLAVEFQNKSYTSAGEPIMGSILPGVLLNRAEHPGRTARIHMKGHGVHVFGPEYYLYRVELDQNAYRYLNAVRNNTIGGFSPFSSPVPVPSNVSGGLGIIAGINRHAPLHVKVDPSTQP